MNNDSPSEPLLDRRINAVRADLAADSLRGLVEAPHYASGHVARVNTGCVSLQKAPGEEMPVVTQIVYGDEVTVYDESDDWAWVQNNRDGYVGYLPSRSLSRSLQQPTHKVTALSTFAYGQPDLKTPLPDKLFMTSRLQAVGEVNGFLQLEDGRFVHEKHTGALEDVADDFVSVAERYLEVPYLWGGCTSDGIDCSGLVQVALKLAGLDCPRDADMQMALDGHDIDLGGMEEMQRGDLVFWNGHVAIMVCDMMLLHANAHHMKVSLEPFHAVVTRTAIHGDDLTAIKRPAALSAGAQ